MEDNRALYSSNKHYWSFPMWKAREETKDIIIGKKKKKIISDYEAIHLVIFVKVKLSFHALI